MIKSVKTFSLLLFIFLVGCSPFSDINLPNIPFLDKPLFGYDNDQVVATVRGTDITMREVRFSYLDSDIEQGIRLMIYKKLTEQEVEKANIDISEYWETNNYFVKDLTPKDEANEYDLENWDFAEKQAKKLNMDPNEYHLQYMEKEMLELSYLEAYFGLFYEMPDSDDHEALAIYNENVNVLLDELAKENEDDIGIFYRKKAIEKQLYKR